MTSSLVSNFLHVAPTGSWTGTFRSEALVWASAAAGVGETRLRRCLGSGCRGLPSLKEKGIRLVKTLSKRGGLGKVRTQNRGGHLEAGLHEYLGYVK